MSKLELPKCLVRIDTANYGRFDCSKLGGAVFLFESSPNESLQVFRAPLELKLQDSIVVLDVKGDRMSNVGWYVRQTFQRGNDLAGEFSESLVRQKLTDNHGIVYDVNCEQAFTLVSAYCAGGTTEGYFLDDRSEISLRQSLLFGAQTLLRRVSSFGFLEQEVRQLADLFYDDFTTLRHTKESREIGQVADAMLL